MALPIGARRRETVEKQEKKGLKLVGQLGVGASESSFQAQTSRQAAALREHAADGRVTMSVGPLLPLNMAKASSIFYSCTFNAKRTSCDQSFEEVKAKLFPHHLKACENYLQEPVETLTGMSQGKGSISKGSRGKTQECAAQAAAVQP